MAEFIPQEGQQAAGPAPEPGQPMGGEFVPQDSPHAQVSNAPMPPGPLDQPEQPAEPELQGQYTDLSGRVMSFVHDTSEDDEGRSNADRVIDMLATKGEPGQVIGYATGTIMQVFHNAAKRQGIEFDGRVLQEVGLDLAEELLALGQTAGFFEGNPDDEEYTPEEEEIIEKAGLEAARLFGEYMKSTGQLTQEKQMDARADMDEQMQREARAGELDDWDGPEATPEMVNQIVQRGAQLNG